MAEVLVVHDPRGYAPKVTGKVMSDRLESLAGKRLFLVDCLFDNSDVFMGELQHWFVEHMPSTETVVIRPKESWVDDEEMRSTVAKEGDAAILGVGL
jgi:hypothetical protein